MPERRPYISQEKKEKMYEEAVKPVTCSTIEDIKRALTPFLKEMPSQEIKLITNINWKDQDKSGVDKVEGISQDVSLRAALLDGMNVVKKRMEVLASLQAACKAAEESEEALPIQNMAVWEVDNLRFRVDTLIQRKLGGKRRGTRIRWEIPGGTYEFDPYLNKLYEIDKSGGEITDKDSK